MSCVINRNLKVLIIIRSDSTYRQNLMVISIMLENMVNYIISYNKGSFMTQYY